MHTRSTLIPTALLVILFALRSQAQVTVSSFTPVTGNVGTSVTISGSGFNTTSTSDVVYFGGAIATVTSASATSLTVTVPAGATPTSRITVINTGTNLQAKSANPFNVIYNGGAGSTLSAASFSNSVSVTSVSNTNSGGTMRKTLDVADFDGDGKIDIVSVGTGKAGVLRNISSGTITSSSFASVISLTTASGSYDLALGDINNDGLIDIVVGCTSNASVFINQSTSGSISFASAQNISITGPIVKLADMDNDGKLDIVSTSNSASTAYIYRNTTSGGSSTVSFASSYSISGLSSAMDFTLGDLNNDGLPDVIAINSSSLKIFINSSTSGSLSFGSAISVTGSIAGSTYAVMSVETADLDNNGTNDIICGNNGTTSSVIFVNDYSSGTFSSSNLSPFTFTVGTNTSQFSDNIVVQDIDGDGKPDILMANSNSSGTFLLQNKYTSGTLSASSIGAQSNIISSITNESIAVADLDGDHKPDIINALYFSSNLSILSNTITTLPVSLVSFTGTAVSSGNELKWITAQEINSNYFDIERSANQSDYMA
ncbi:MAG: VCBS repeat-containing protein, partial [Bacteroidetes bacterium]|nr:VCBS repeat-containing protein [Bacteroidota bacterium]